MPWNLLVTPGPVKGGVIEVPGDKSISHRAVLLSALADRETYLHGFLESRDCMQTLDAVRQLGVDWKKPQTCHGSFHVINGKGLNGLVAPGLPIDCGNSGTGMRLLAGVLAGQPFESTLIGDESLSKRPMRRIAEPLAQMGARIEPSEGGTPPLRIQGKRPLHGIDYVLPIPSAQVKSAILLAGLFADTPLSVTEPGISRDHTERMLAAFGVDIRREGARVSMQPPQKLTSPGAIDVPRDLSSAAFFMTLAAITPGCRIELPMAGVNPTRDGVIRLLKRMGANIEIQNLRETRGGEPLADIVVSHSSLHGIEIGADDVALAIDEIPALLIAAACAKGRTELRGAAELKVKESDRLTAMASGLKALGIEVEEFEDGLALEGGQFSGGEIDSQGDHRIAMAFAVAGAVARSPVVIRDTKNIATSFPNFVALARQAGLNIQEEVA